MLALSFILEKDQVDVKDSSLGTVTLKGSLAITVAEECSVTIGITLRGQERITIPPSITGSKSEAISDVVSNILEIRSNTFGPHNPIHLSTGTTQLPFTLPVTAAAQPSFTHSSASISYNLYASVSYDEHRATAVHPIRIVRTSSPMSTVYWGSTRDHRWQYEFEVPRMISLDEEEVVPISARVRCVGSKKQMWPMKELDDCCLVGCQLWEFITISLPSQTYTTHTQTIDPFTIVKKKPSSSWKSPMRLLAHLAPGRIRPDLSSPHITIKHLLHLTVAIPNSSQEDVVLDFPVVVAGAHEDRGVQEDVGCAHYVFEKELTRRDSGTDVSAMASDLRNLKDEIGGIQPLVGIQQLPIIAAA